MENQISILLIDDDDNFLKVMSKNLRNKGCFVSIAHNHEEALKLLVSRIHHIAFIDCILFSEEGIELVHKMREILGHSLDIVLISGILSEENIRNVKNLNHVRYLNKPLKDKDILSVIKEAKSKFIHGEVSNFLFKLFKKDTQNINKLKFLVGLQQANDMEFFLILNQLLESEEKGSIKFSFDNSKEHEIFFEDKMIINYIYFDSTSFLDRLVNSGHIDQKDRNKMVNIKPEDLDHEIISQCYVGPNIIAQVKKEILIETFKKIPQKENIKLHSTIFKSSHNFFQIDKSEFIQTVFSLFNQFHPTSSQSLFTSDLMNFILLPGDLAEGSKNTKRQTLNEVKAQKKFDSDLDFYKFVLKSLMESQNFLHIQKSKHSYIKERFDKIYSHISGKSSRAIFQFMEQLDSDASIPNSKAKEIYSNFIKLNHTDKFSHVSEKDIIKSINQCCHTLRKAYEELIDPKAQLLLNEREQKMQMNKEAERAENKKRVNHLLTDEKYQEALNIIITQAETVLEKDIEWQILYLWSVYKMDNQAKIKEKRAKEFLNNLIRDKMNLDKTLYFYVLGLHYLSIENRQKAINNFQKVKLIDPSFRPVNKDLKKLLLEKKQETKKRPFDKLSDLINKKTG